MHRERNKGRKKWRNGRNREGSDRLSDLEAEPDEHRKDVLPSEGLRDDAGEEGASLGERLALLRDSCNSNDCVRKKGHRQPTD